LSASLPEPVERLLRGLVSAHETPIALTGGVSSEIWKIGNVCVKRALPRLRVAQLWEAPVERNRYERMWLEAAAAAAPGCAPKVLAWDDEAGLFAMECVERPVWKELLRQGQADARFAAQVGRTLGVIHQSTSGNAELARRFATDAIFHAIRLEPYLVFTSRKHPQLRERLAFLVERTARTRVCLVHGDVSPKNILVGGERPAHFPVFLDAECAWYGDPAFDLAFCLNHLLLKCLWVPQAKPAFLECFEALSRAYLESVSFPGIEERTASLLPALLLARVDGKSPVEYLRESDKESVRRTARGLFAAESLSAIRTAWQRSSTS
jgi:aminoglycoside phosphotransferase (APT) family kinase protein